MAIDAYKQRRNHPASALYHMGLAGRRLQPNVRVKVRLKRRSLLSRHMQLVTGGVKLPFTRKMQARLNSKRGRLVPSEPVRRLRLVANLPG